MAPLKACLPSRPSFCSPGTFPHSCLKQDSRLSASMQGAIWNSLRIDTNTANSHIRFGCKSFREFRDRSTLWLWCLLAYSTCAFSAISAFDLQGDRRAESQEWKSLGFPSSPQVLAGLFTHVKHYFERNDRASSQAYPGEAPLLSSHPSLL